MNIVAIDHDQLAGEADYPMLSLDKYGWQQFLRLDQDEVEERCWRADVVISSNTPVDTGVIDKSFKLKLIIAAGDDYRHIDLEAARARQIQVSHTPGLDPKNPNHSQLICDQIIEIIEAFLKNTALHAVN